MITELTSPGREVEALLVEAGLPASDLAGNPRIELLGVREGGRLVAVVGIECYETVGLIRSLVVSPAFRSAGLGAALVSEAEVRAVQQGVDVLYLLTTTAADFFAHRGYEVVERSQAPAAIAGTAQFTELCPASAVFMRKELTAGTSTRVGAEHAGSG